MAAQYRISKYNPIYRNESGHYLKDEWTEISDLGKTYQGEVLKLSEYLDFENICIGTIISIINYNDISINQIGVHFYVNQADYFNQGNENNILKYIYPGQLIDNEYMLSEILKLLLRYENWFILRCEDFFITIGYDSYFFIGYFNSKKNLKIPSINEKIFVEPYYYGDGKGRFMKYNPKTWRGWSKYLQR